MTLATNPNLREDGLSEMDYWQLAYNQAIQVYGQYSLVPDYSSLFTDTNENSVESIGNFKLVNRPLILKWEETLPLGNIN